MNKLFSVLCLALSVLLVGCEDDAKIASRNISKAADNFEVNRRIVFINGITDTYPLVIEGRCSIGSGLSSRSVTVTCKVGPKDYRKHFLGLSDNMTYMAEQLEAADVSLYHHRITFKPQSILPDIDFRGSAEELIENKDVSD